MVEFTRVEWSWQEFGTSELGGESSASPVFDGRYLVDSTRSDRGSAVVVDTTNDRIVIDHGVPDFDAGWAAHTAFLMDPWFIITEANSVGAGAIRAYRYDLRSGDRTSLTATEGFPPPGPVWSAANGLAVFVSNDEDRRVSCLIVLEVASLQWSERWCDPGEQFVDWVRLGPEGAVTFRTQEGSVPEREPCTRLFRLAAVGDTNPTEVPLVEACKGFSGAGGVDWTVWSEVGLRSPSITRSHAYGQLPNGDGVELGDIQTGTVTACAGWIYWQVEVPASSSEELRRWRPGSSGEIVFETPPDSLLGTQECAGDWLTVVVAESGVTETTFAARGK